MTNKKILIAGIVLLVILLLPVNAQDIKKSQNEAIITIRGNIENRGSILYVTDSSLILWRTSKSYDKNKLNEYAAEMFYSDIDLIVLTTTKGTQKQWGLGCGLAGFTFGFLGNLLAQSVVNDAGRVNILPMLQLGVMFGVAGGLVGFGTGHLIKVNKSDVLLIKGDYDIFKAVIPKLKLNAIFPYLPSPELQEFLTPKTK